MHGSKQLAQRKKEATSQQSVLIEDNLYEVATSIPTQKATNMKDIAHHAQRAIVRQGFTARQACRLGLLRLRRGRSVEPLMSPDNHIVGQAAQQNNHLLGFKAFFAACGAAQPLMVTLERRFYSTTALIIQIHIRKPHAGRIGVGHGGRLGQGQHLGGSQFTSSTLPPPASRRTNVRWRLRSSNSKVCSAASIRGGKALGRLVLPSKSRSTTTSP